MGFPPMLFRRINSGASRGDVGGWGAECFLLRDWVSLNIVGGGGAGFSLEDFLRTEGVAGAGTRCTVGEENLV